MRSSLLTRLFVLAATLCIVCSLAPGRAFAEEGEVAAEIAVAEATVTIVVDGSAPTGSDPSWTYEGNVLKLSAGHTYAVTGTAFPGEVENHGMIVRGTFDGHVQNMQTGTIAGGYFGYYEPGVLNNYGTITGGNFTGRLENAGRVSGGTFGGGSFGGDSFNKVLNETDGTIAGGTFVYGVSVENKGTISSGAFERGSKITNRGGVVAGGVFDGDVFNFQAGYINGGTFNETGRLLVDGTSVVTGGAIYSGGYNGVENHGTLAGGTFSTWQLLNYGTIQNGSSTIPLFTAPCRVENFGTIAGGMFEKMGGSINGLVNNSGTISGGEFKESFVENGREAAIQSGMFDDSRVDNFGTIADGTFNGGGALNYAGGIVTGGRFWNIITDLGGTITQCKYRVTFNLSHMTADAKKNVDGEYYATYASSGEGGFSCTLRPASGYLLPTSAVVDRWYEMQHPDGHFEERVITCNPDECSFDSSYGLLSIKNAAITGPITVTASGAFDIAGATVDPLLDQMYTGSAVELKPVVKHNGATLIEWNDYELSYQGNNAAGTASVIIKGVGAYTGIKTVSFNIISESAKVPRLAGDIALDTMASITKQGFPTGSCDTVIVATMGGYWDALTASSLAGLNGCPILLTDGDALSRQTASEIDRLKVGQVYIAGGTAAISSGVESSLSRLSSVKAVKRLAGATAIDTALKIYEEGKGSWGETAVVATSETFHDALSVSPYAYAKKAPIFLANASTHILDPQVLSTLKAGGFKNVVIVGGPAAIALQVEESQLKGMSCVRLAGATAFETSGAIASWCLTQGMTVTSVGVATGTAYYDALAGAAFCGKNNSVLVLVADGRTTNVDGFIRSHKSSIGHAYVFGGPAAVSAGVYGSVVDALK